MFKVYELGQTWFLLLKGSVIAIDSSGANQLDASPAFRLRMEGNHKIADQDMK
jgi:hypothetical protein